MFGIKTTARPNSDQHGEFCRERPWRTPFSYTPPGGSTAPPWIGERHAIDTVAGLPYRVDTNVNGPAAL